MLLGDSEPGRQDNKGIRQLSLIRRRVDQTLFHAALLFEWMNFKQRRALLSRKARDECTIATSPRKLVRGHGGRAIMARAALYVLLLASRGITSIRSTLSVVYTLFNNWWNDRDEAQPDGGRCCT